MESVIEFKLPALGENIEQGDLVRLMVAPGATVSEGQAVMELETDKAVVEVPSSVSGTVKEILVKEGDKIKVGQVVFTADGNGPRRLRQPTNLAEAAVLPERKRPHAPAADSINSRETPVAASANASKPQLRQLLRSCIRKSEQRTRSTDAAHPPNSACRSLEKTFHRAIWCG